MNGLRLITLTAGEETVDLGARLLLVGCVASACQRVSARLRGNERGEIGELFDLQRGQLITRLRRLQCPNRGLACRDERVRLAPGGRERLDDTRLQRSKSWKAA